MARGGGGGGGGGGGSFDPAPLVTGLLMVLLRCNFFRPSFLHLIT